MIGVVLPAGFSSFWGFSAHTHEREADKFDRATETEHRLQYHTPSKLYISF